MAIKASSLDYRALAAYLVDGITWKRLKDVAVTDRASGGLNLFRDLSPECIRIFGKSPEAIIASRPDTDLKFLKLLRSREHILHRVASRDLEQRTLNNETRNAVRNLGSIEQRICRTILGEILERCMFLLKWSQEHQRITLLASWDALMQQAVESILDLDTTPETLRRLGVTEDEIRAFVDPPRTWVEVLVLQVVGDRDLVPEHLQKAYDFHRQVTDAASAHLNLLADNTFRTPWMAAKLLSKDKHVAKGAAQSLLLHIATTRPGNRTAFEEHLVNTTKLWEDIEGFSKEDPPIVLWHGLGKYEVLFKFLAPRFLLGPDHVLDCERIHARWKRMCEVKKALQMHNLNASLRLIYYLENNLTFPSSEILMPHLLSEAAQQRLDMQALQDGDIDVALGWRLIGTPCTAECILPDADIVVVVVMVVVMVVVVAVVVEGKE